MRFRVSVTLVKDKRICEPWGEIGMTPDTPSRVGITFTSSRRCRFVTAAWPAGRHIPHARGWNDTIKPTIRPLLARTGSSCNGVKCLLGGSPGVDNSDKPWTNYAANSRSRARLSSVCLELEGPEGSKRRQAEAHYSCGAASLCTLLQLLWGDKVGEQKVLDTVDAMLKLEERRERIKNGLSLTDLRRVSVKLGYLSSIGTLTYEQLSQSKIPVIVPLTIGKFNHFVVYRVQRDLRLPCRLRPAAMCERESTSPRSSGKKMRFSSSLRRTRIFRENAPLTLTAPEVYLGTLNKVVIQKQVAAPISSGFTIAHP